jgi:cellulose biosynthesis protein BcsQ
MQTIAFYSYKGGTGRSLALANAAHHLARMEFKVVALDLDLEAPGLHYKFSDVPNSPLSVDKGVADYLHSFVQNGEAPTSLGPFSVDAPVPGRANSPLKLIPAGNVTSPSYWTRLSSLDWHQLLYSTTGPGVAMFMELKARIKEELNPDFLLIDSRTGITEIGGVATTLMADKVICIVLPTRENLDGARTVLQSMVRTRRDNEQPALDLMIALSRISPSDGDNEQKTLTRVKTTLCEPALESRDTLTCSGIFVLHTEGGLEHDPLRVGSGVSPDDSVLLRDYLRLFANVVPAQSIGAKLGALIDSARNKMWERPDIAQKELEELAESFGRPEVYRALLHLYKVRNVTGNIMLRTAQRLWDLSGDSSDPLVWETIQREFRGGIRHQRPGASPWSPELNFIESVWREAGKKDPVFSVRLADAYSAASHVAKAADLLVDVIAQSTWIPAVIEQSAWVPQVLGTAVRMLDAADRRAEASQLIHQHLDLFQSESGLVDAWAELALHSGDPDALAELTKPPVVIAKAKPMLAAQVYLRCNLLDEASAIADDALRQAAESRSSSAELVELGKLFNLIGRWEEFEAQVEGQIPAFMLQQVKNRVLKQGR